MPTFHYKAKNINAQTVEGKIKADTKEQAIEKIALLRLTPITVEEKNHNRVKSGLAKTGTVKPKELYNFSRQLSNLLKAGVPLLRSLEIMIPQTSNLYFRSVLNNVIGGIREGKTFSDSLGAYPSIFSFMYRTMIKAGEESGNIKDTLLDISEYYKLQNEIASKIRMALIYPFIMLLFGIATIFFILTYVMPKITGMFSNLNQALPVPTLLLMRISEFTTKWWFFIIIFFGILFFVIKNWLSTKSGRSFISQAQLSLPFVKDFFVKVNLARFCRTLQLLLKSGTSLVRSLQLSIPIVSNELIQNQLNKCKDDLIAGGSFGKSIKESTIIPSVVGDLIMIGEESGSLDDTLQNIADDYEQIIHETIKVMMTLIEPIMIILIGLVIGFIVISMLLPIFQLDMFA